MKSLSHRFRRRPRRRVYLDYAATTPLDPRVWRVMAPFYRRHVGNPSSIHREGVESRNALERARSVVARLLTVRPEEIVFVGSGTEANNLAIRGVVEACALRGRFNKLHVVTTAIEHSSVRKTCAELSKRGVELTTLPVKENGIVDLHAFERSLRKETILVSVMYANNEIGVIQPIKALVRILKNHAKTCGTEPVFHTDASQAPLYLRVDVPQFGGVSLMVLDGHKMYGPGGVGMLFVRRGTRVVPILFGGTQEGGRWPGTENIPAIVGFAEALRLAVSERKKESARLSTLRDYFLRALHRACPEAIVNGDLSCRLPNNISISIPGVDAEFLAVQLDDVGIACSTKSACLREGNVSYVIESIRKDPSLPKDALRISLGRGTERRDLDYLLSCVTRFARQQRGILLPRTAV